MKITMEGLQEAILAYEDCVPMAEIAGWFGVTRMGLYKAFKRAVRPDYIGACAALFFFGEVTGASLPFWRVFCRVNICRVGFCVLQFVAKSNFVFCLLKECIR